MPQGLEVRPELQFGAGIMAYGFSSQYITERDGYGLLGSDVLDFMYLPTEFASSGITIVDLHGICSLDTGD